MSRTGLLVVVCAVAIAGCGGSDEQSDEPQATGVDTYTEEQVVDALGLTSEGVSFESASGCYVSVVMTSKGQVDTYRDAGDPVVSNADGTAGVKFDGSQKCADEFTAAFKKLP